MRAPDSESIFEEYERAVAYNSSIDLYETVRQNENFFIGKQWEGVSAPDLDKPVMNILKRVVSYFLSSIVSDDVTAQVSAMGSARVEEELLQAANQQFDEIVEHTQLKAKNRDVLRNAAVDGDGCLHFYYQVPEEAPRETGPGEGGPLDLGALQEAARRSLGSIEAEVLDNTSVYFGNPQVWDVQKQPYILISYRRMLGEVRAQARRAGLSEEGIAADDDPNGINTQNESGKVTVVRRYWREKGQVWCAEAARGGLVMKPKNLQYARYPLAWMSWDKIKNSFHGQAALTGLIPNQIFINKMFAMAMEHLKRGAFPTVIYDRMKLPGGWTNRVGAAIGVQGPPNEAVAGNFRPADMSAQVMQMIDAAIGYTRDTMGASDAALGNIRPDNTSAIIAVQKASSMPLELQRMAFYQFVEDCMRVFLDMMATDYGVRPAPGGEEAGYVDFGLLRGALLKLNVDVGAASYWSELMQVQTLDNLFGKGILPDPLLYLESIPRGYVPNRQKIMEELRRQAQPQQAGPLSPEEEGALPTGMGAAAALLGKGGEGGAVPFV